MTAGHTLQLTVVLDRIRQAVERRDFDAAQEALNEWERSRARGMSLDRLLQLAGLGVFASEVGHELRQPLLGVKAFAQMLAEMPADEEAVRKRANAIVDQALRMEVLLDRLSDAVRGRDIQRVHEELDLNELVRSATGLLEQLWRKKKVTLELDLADGLPPIVGDAHALVQILTNLAVNAQQALGGAGTVSVSTLLADGAVRVEVKDDGPGVPEAVRPRLFEPYFTSKADGTGLGLHLSREIARSHGGDLELLPDNGPGATFRLTLPV